MTNVDVIVIGAGPAGLCAALEVAKAGLTVTVLESDPERVGGISRTVSHEGYSFDIGGHRFFSKSKEVNDLWHDLLPDDLVERPRLSRIFYKGKFYSYPLQPLEALRNLGIIEATRCVLSFLKARRKPTVDPKTFEDWVVNAFGKRLFSIFFQTYSEKVWGVPCSQISADWAAQRIKGLDLGMAIKEAFRRALGMATGNAPKTLIGSFLYPRKGPGMMWKAASTRVSGAAGSRVLLGRDVISARHQAGHWTVETRDAGGTLETFASRHLVSTTDIRGLAGILPHDRTLAEHSGALKYRDYILVAVALDKPDLFPDNWIYVHDASIKTGRIQNFGSWSPDMLATPDTSCLGFEYFCDEGDALWTMADADLTRLALSDLKKLGFAPGAKPVMTTVVRQRKAYPVYDGIYRGHVEAVRSILEHAYPTLHLAGRNGMHRYNNQDHAMMSAVLTGRNIVAGYRKFDPWLVNDDAEYHEGEVPKQTFTPPLPIAVIHPVEALT